MGHANSKIKKKGLEKHKSRSFSFKKKKDNSINNINNNSSNNINNINNNATTTSNNTSTSNSPTSTSTSISAPPTPSPSLQADYAEDNHRKELEIKDKLKEHLPLDPLDSLNNSYDSKNEDNSKLNNKMKKKRTVLRESTVFVKPSSENSSISDAGSLVVGLDDIVVLESLSSSDLDDMCPLCEESNLEMYSMEVCGHSVCVPCLYAYSEFQLKQLVSDTQSEILCPVPECNCIVASSDLQAALETFGALRVNHTHSNGNGKSPKEADGDGADGEIREEHGEDFSANSKRKSSDVAGISLDDASNTSGVSGKEVELDGEVAIEDVGESSSRGSRPAEYVPRLPIRLTHSLELLLSKGNYIHCPNPECKFVFERLPPSSRKKSEVVLDDAGNPISPEASKHRDEHRFRCRVCGTNFCAACKSVPYHLGFTCKQKIASMRAKHCRFCDVSLPANAKPHNAKTAPVLPKKKDKNYRKSFLLRWKGKEKSKPDLTLVELDSEPTVEENPKEFFVCKAKECASKMTFACSRFLDCGHVCAGTSTDLPSECFCLKEGCCGEAKQNGDEFCNICWTETLGSGPCYRLGCSHVFHVSCVTSKLSKEWPGPSISFAFLNCPLCSQMIQHRSLERTVNVHRQLLEQVKSRALQRLEFEGMLNDPRVIDPESEFHGKPTEYAMSIFSFYLCFVCRHPYFGGRRQCEVPQPAEGAEVPPFNPQELLCGGCSTLNAKCSKHGKEYIEYKCRFCCSLATFYCGGKAHFCTTCHDKAGQLVEFINWTTTAKCEPCKGPGLCPLGMQHKENGEEFSLGCSICRLSGV